MRHRKGFNHLSRTSAHRKAMMANMASSLILHKRIRTTTAKAKALRMYVEPLITKSKEDSTHSRRVVFSYLQDKNAVSELFREVSPKIMERPGGYTRILKIGNRLGDNADMCIIELVDYNENLLETQEAAKAKSTRRRRGKKKTADQVPTVDAVEETVTDSGPEEQAEKPVVEDVQTAGVVEENALPEEAQTEESAPVEATQESDVEEQETPEEPTVEASQTQDVKEEKTQTPDVKEEAPHESPDKKEVRAEAEKEVKTSDEPKSEVSSDTAEEKNSGSEKSSEKNASDDEGDPKAEKKDQ